MMEQQTVAMVGISAYARRFVSKAIAALLCSRTLAWMIYQLMVKDAAQGKEAYVASQVAYFEQSLSPPSAAILVFYGVLVCIFLFMFLFMYEVISLGIYLLIRERKG